MLKEVIRRVRPNPPLETPPTRISIRLMSMGHLTMPSLRWWDGEKTPTHHKLPLLGLKFSSNSFLDASLKDDLSATTVYTVKTTEASTTVLRYGNEDNPLEIATINWPGAASANEAKEDDNLPLVKMKGCRWSKGPVFLRSGSNPNSSSRKFTIPDYSHTMKWKRYGTSYWCTTSGIKGPIAKLDLANGQEPISLEVYETLRDKSDYQVLPACKGVSFLLLDYLIVTALLCVTDVSAWMEVGAMQDLTPSNDTNSSQELGDMSKFPDQSSALRSRKLGSKSSESSLVTIVSAFPQPPSRLYGPGIPTTDASRSMWYTETPKIEDSSKDYLALSHSTTPNSSTEALQHPGASASQRPIYGFRNIPSVLPLRSQLSTSLSLPKSELSRSLDRSTTTSIHSPQQSLLGLENKESSPSEQLPNISKSTAPIGSKSYRRPLPKPPRESALRRTQSSISSFNSPMSATSTRTFRSLPPTPLLQGSEPKESRAPVSDNSRIHSRSPPMTKASQELTRWVHELTGPQRVLPPTPLPKTVVFDLRPPSYSSIYFAQGAKSNCITTPTTTVPST